LELFAQGEYIENSMAVCSVYLSFSVMVTASAGVFEIYFVDDKCAQKFSVISDNLRYINSGVHKFSKNLGTTSKFWALEGLHKASSILSTHKYLTPLNKILLSGQPGTWNLCASAVIHNYVWPLILDQII
jgi:hypothetical protein